MATVALWAGSFPAIGLAVRHIDPAGLAALRFALAAAAAASWLAWRREALPRRADWPRILACALLGVALYNLLLNLGQRTVSPGAAGFIVATQTVFAAGLSHLLGEQRAGAGVVAGTALSLLGVAVISSGQPGGGQFGSGAPLVVAAAACSGATFVLQRRLALRYGAARAAGWPLVAGALLLAPWLPGGVEQGARSPEAVAAVLFLAFGSGLLGYLFWMKALAGLGAARAANLLFLMAPLATLMAIPIDGRLPGISTIAGGAAALAGVAIVNRSYRRPPSTDTES